jgi:phospholipid/cholesterol/gamma-HCH transport system permease protein
MSRDAVNSSNKHADITLIQGTPSCTGNWNLQGIEGLEKRINRLPWPAGKIVIDGAKIQAFDTNGALLLIQIIDSLRRTGRDVQVINLSPIQQGLLTLVSERNKTAHVPSEPVKSPNFVSQLGKLVWKKVAHALEFLAFLGETTVVLLKALLWPGHIRWRILFANIESAGLNAVPIVGLLSFLIGVVIAYQGGNQLLYYGANIFIVDLVSLTMLRELAPLLTSIIVAGRTGSAFAAQIGTMQVTEEIDALRTIGVNPYEILVLPKLLSLCVALPLLCLFANVMSILGGMVVAYFMLNISFGEFVARLPQVVTLFSFLFGIGKTPVFATVIALVGCYHGFRVRGGADSVGRQTTESVVQAIFLVIIADALFAVFMGTKGLYR